MGGLKQPGILGRWLGVLLAQVVIAAAAAAPLTPGNILVSIAPGLNSYLGEYTPTGTLLQSEVVPYPSPPRPSSEDVRDIVVTASGQVAIYNGTFDPYMTRWQPDSNAWSHTTYADWSTIAADSYGGIAAWQKYVYCTDMETSADVHSGVIRFDTASGSATRFFDDTDFADVTIGFDGLLYALWPDAPVVYVIDPLTMVVQRSFSLTAPCHGFAVGSGFIFGASGNGNLYKFSMFGTTLDVLDADLGSLTDVDIDASGRLVAGTREGWVVTSDSSFSSLGSFRATDHIVPTFVSFTTPVPEPTPLLAGVLCVAVGVRRPRTVAARGGSATSDVCVPS